MDTIADVPTYGCVIAVREVGSREFLIDTVVMPSPSDADIQNVIGYCHGRSYAVVMVRRSVTGPAMDLLVESVADDACDVSYSELRCTLRDGVDALLTDRSALPDDGYGERQ